MFRKAVNREQAVQVYKYLREEGFFSSYDAIKNKLVFERDEEKIHLQLSIETCFVDGKMIALSEPYLLVLIQSGSASVGVYRQNECLRHKVFGAYMVRKKQGKSQVKYLKTKGKSRAGSRIRLASTVKFFEEINERLLQDMNAFSINRIALSCSKVLAPLFYGSKVVTPFEKTDERIISVPVDVKQPNFTEMTRVHKQMMKNELSTSDLHQLDDLVEYFDFM